VSVNGKKDSRFLENLFIGLFQQKYTPPPPMDNNLEILPRGGRGWLQKSRQEGGL